MECERCGATKDLKVICGNCLLASQAMQQAAQQYALVAQAGNYVRGVRRSRGLTQKQFAEQMRVGSATIARWESGRYSPSGDQVQKLLDLTRQISEEDE